MSKRLLRGDVYFVYFLWDVETDTVQNQQTMKGLGDDTSFKKHAEAVLFPEIST